MYYLLLSLWAGSLESEKMNAIHAKNVDGTVLSCSENAALSVIEKCDSEAIKRESIAELPLQ